MLFTSRTSFKFTLFFLFFFFNDTATTEIYTLSLHDALPILGTAPSARGPVFRGLICYRVYDGLRNFQRHPTEPTTGHGELVWHYTRPTPLYPMFETRQNKPLHKPFVSLVSFYYQDNQWRFDVMVRKTEAE